MRERTRGKLATASMLFFVFILILSACNNNVNKETALHNNYLSKNYSIIDINEDNLNSFDIIKKDALENEIILAGEAHGTSKNFDIKLSLLKYLHKNAEVKYLLCESGYASTKLLDNYIQTGDIEKLDLVFNNLEGRSIYSKEAYNFWKNLYEYNKTLADDKKIIAVGIDVEHQLRTGVSYLKMLTETCEETKTLPENIKKSISSMDKIFDELSYSEKFVLIDDLNHHISYNEADYKAFFEDMFFDFKFTVKNMRDRLSSGNGDFYVEREKRICENFKELYSRYPKGKYFGQWGGAHILQHKDDRCFSYSNSIASFLKEKDSPINGKILSISYNYKNSKNMNNDFVEKDMTDYINNYDLLKDYVTTDYTLFKLNGENTPYSNKTTFIIKPLGGNTLDYFQYILVVSNSKGSTKLK